MKINKRKLINLLKDNLEHLGYHYFDDTATGSKGLFVKKVRSKYYLTLGLEISAYYDSLFTASFYLSKTTRWSSTWGDIPNECYERVGTLLNVEERANLLSEEYIKPGVVDAWWDAAEEQELNNFIRTIEISESRFCSDDLLLKKIDESEEVKELVQHALDTINTVKNGEINDDLHFCPKELIDSIPMVWFQAAEIVIIRNNSVLNKNTIKSLAADSWRQYVIDNMQ